MRKKCFNTFLLFITICCLICLVPHALANNLGRDFEPKVVSGSAFEAFYGAPLNELFLYAYIAETKSWQQIPFQIDEKFDSENFVYEGQKDNTDGLDDNDELVFMLKDAGDHNTFSWLDDIDSQNYIRYEVRLVNPLNEEAAYVYLYRSKSLTPDPDLVDYVKYFPSETAEQGEDRVLSLFYDIRHRRSSLPVYLSIPESAGGNGKDLVEEMKFRAKAKMSVFTIDIDENMLDLDESRGDHIQIIDGRIRIVRKVDAALEVPIVGDIDFVLPPGYFYPYSSFIEVRVPSISDASISDVRISLNLTEEAVGMKFTSAKNSPTLVPIDGSSDDAVLDKSLDGGILPDGNWMFFGEGNATQGTLVTLFPIAQDIGGSRSLYYVDSKNGNAYGHGGISIGGNVDTPFILTYKGYYLSSSYNSSIGGQIASFEQNPVQATSIMQDISTVPVELVTFDATVEGNKVSLKWQTASESNNFGFDVELGRAEDEWRKIGFVEGSGSTVEPKFYHFVVDALQPGEYNFRLKQIDTDGAFEYSQMVSVSISVPTDFALQQNFPNPFNPTTTINFQIPHVDGDAVKTSLKIYDLLGKEVVTLLNESRSPGIYSITWNATDKNGLSVPSGIYLYRLQSGNYTDMRKMILVK